jgi:endonuclease/exonuclease/phosphatase family metal-dependent hydrolase
LDHTDRRLSYIGQVFRALEVYRDWIGEQDTILMGDFNSNKQFDRKRPVNNHSAVVASLKEHGIASTYHHFYNEAQGEESWPTQFMNRDRSRSFHLDYCFLPESWLPRITSLQIGSYADWVSLSDHCPLRVDLG